MNLKTSISSALARLSAKVIALRDRKDGLAAVEFAMVLPVMVIMYLGCCEVSLGFSASKKVDSVARALSDLTSQAAAQITQAQMNDIIAAATGVMQPFDGSATRLAITSFIMPTPASGPVKAFTDWSYVRSGTATGCGDKTLLVPAGFLSPGKSIIKADVSYTYYPLLSGPFRTIGDGSVTSLNLTSTLWMQPRILPRVQLAATVAGTCVYSPAKTFP
jgi:Flp pilus assembly protein TadG